MGKSDSLYNHGMKVLVYSSKKEVLEKKGGWYWTGSNICHYQN